MQSKFCVLSLTAVTKKPWVPGSQEPALRPRCRGVAPGAAAHSSERNLALLAVAVDLFRLATLEELGRVVSALVPGGLRDAWSQG